MDGKSKASLKQLEDILTSASSRSSHIDNITYINNIINDAYTLINDKYNNDFAIIKDSLETMTFHELRNVATVVSKLDYGKITISLYYPEKKSLIDCLNKEFDKRLGEVVRVYDTMDRLLNRDEAYEENRYKLLALHNDKGYGEIKALKHTVWYMHLVGTSITINSVHELSSILRLPLHWIFYSKDDVQKETEIQNKFVAYVFVGNIDEAYKLIKPEIDKIL